MENIQVEDIVGSPCQDGAGYSNCLIERDFTRNQRTMVASSKRPTEVIHVHAGRVIEYFRVRKKEGGGFGQTPRLPATIEDTYYALRCLRVLKEASIPIPPELLKGHESFLLRLWRKDLVDPRAIYQLLWSMGFIGINLDIPIIRYSKVKTLDNLFYMARIQNEFMKKGPLEKGANVQAREVRTVKDLRMYLYLNKGSLIEEEKEGWARWLIECQNPDGGFGFMPGTTSYMENCHYAVEAMGYIGITPCAPRALLNFIASSKSARGGFGRKNMGVPFPSSTWHAMGTLYNLSLMDTNI